MKVAAHNSRASQLGPINRPKRPILYTSLLSGCCQSRVGQSRKKTPAGWMDNGGGGAAAAPVLFMLWRLWGGQSSPMMAPTKEI